MNDDWFLHLSDETSDEDIDQGKPPNADNVPAREPKNRKVKAKNASKTKKEKGTYLSCYSFNALSFKSSVLVEVKLVVSNLKYIFMALGHVQFRSISFPVCEQPILFQILHN